MLYYFKKLFIFIAVLLFYFNYLIILIYLIVIIVYYYAYSIISNNIIATSVCDEFSQDLIKLYNSIQLHTVFKIDVITNPEEINTLPHKYKNQMKIYF